MSETQELSTSFEPRSIFFAPLTLVCCCCCCAAVTSATDQFTTNTCFSGSSPGAGSVERISASHDLAKADLDEGLVRLKRNLHAADGIFVQALPPATRNNESSPSATAGTSLTKVYERISRRV